MISVIIPAYKASKYIDECLASIKGECEILIGVDACEETYNHIKHLDNVYYFTKNVGPFVIKNTLMDIAKYENVLFFDADDVMAEDLIEKFISAIQQVDYVTLNYVDFHTVINPHLHMFNNATVGIKKSVFNSLNGFYPWRCGGDTEFDYRVKYNNIKHKNLDGVNYYRRIHGNNLTMRKDTGYGSEIRKHYTNIINTNIRARHWPNPETKTIQEYVKD
jgi:glycosyltransferase involved in cell wall biosynthesis